MKQIIFIIINLCISFTCFSINLENVKKINELENKYEIKIYYEYGTHFFPPHLYKKPLSVEGKQIEDKEIYRLLQFLQQFLNRYSNEVVSNNLDAIYLLQKINVKQKDISIASFGRGIYLTDSCNGKLTPDSLLIAGLHDKFNSLLYDNYPNIILDSIWSSTNLKGFNYEENNNRTLIPRDSLFNLGFVSTDGMESVRSDFISFAIFYHTNYQQLKQIKEKYPLINKKLIQYLLFIKKFENNETKISKSLLKKITKIEKLYGIKIQYNYNIAIFPDLWCTKPSLVNANQVNENNINEALKIINKTLNHYSKKMINNTLKNIYIIEGLKYENKSYLCLHDYSSVYLSIDSVNTKEYKEKYFESIISAYSSIIETNFWSLIPLKDWRIIKPDTSIYNIKEDINSCGFLSKDALNSEYYDINDFITNYTYDRPNLKKLGKNNSLIRKKTEIIKFVLNNANNLVDSIVKNKNYINNKVYEIEKIYNIKITWDYQTNKPPFNIILPPSLIIDEKINLIQSYREINIIYNFLKSFPHDFIIKELSNILMFGSMHYNNSNSTIGGTIDNSSKSLYLVNIGHSNEYLSGIIYHEFSHLIVQKYWNTFPYDEWLKLNPPDFKYVPNGIKSTSDTYDTGDYYYKQGVIDNYASTNFNDDYAELAKWMFTKKNELKEILSENKILQAKYNLLKDFFLNINPKINL